VDVRGGRGGGDKVVFVTSQLYSGRIGGVSAADLKCQTLAQTAGLPGEFRAWLSSASRTPDGHFRPSAQPYRLVDGTLVANGWDDLLNEEYPEDTFCARRSTRTNTA
jgi:hypothetical protein